MHISVLADEAMKWLNVREDGVYVDGTAGAGGHTLRIAELLGPSGRVIGLDRDASAVELAGERVREYAQARVVRGNYGELGRILRELGIEAVDGVLIDAGVSSMQIDKADRGFSFQEEGPLDMRMDADSGLSAAEWLSDISQDDLADVLRLYGDLKKAKSIARAICARRDGEGMTTTQDLKAAVAEVFSFVTGMPDETRQVFQAIRIAVNDELRWLESGLRDSIEHLKPGGRLVAISFHSGEDRIIKNILRDASRKHEVLYPDGRVKERIPPVLKLLTPKPVLPSEEETRANPRASSAKLRAAERLAV